LEESGNKTEIAIWHFPFSSTIGLRPLATTFISVPHQALVENMTKNILKHTKDILKSSIIPAIHPSRITKNLQNPIKIRLAIGPWRVR
jgi:hypothetical protein